MDSLHSSVSRKRVIYLCAHPFSFVYVCRTEHPKMQAILCPSSEDVHILRYIWSGLMKRDQMVAEVAATQVWPRFTEGSEPEESAG